MAGEKDKNPLSQWVLVESHLVWTNYWETPLTAGAGLIGMETVQF